MKFFTKFSIRQVILNNLWLKIISLVIAVIVWLIASGLIVELPKGIRV